MAGSPKHQHSVAVVCEANEARRDVCGEREGAEGLVEGRRLLRPRSFALSTASMLCSGVYNRLGEERGDLEQICVYRSPNGMLSRLPSEHTSPHGVESVSRASIRDVRASLQFRSRRRGAPRSTRRRPRPARVASRSRRPQSPVEGSRRRRGRPMCSPASPRVPP